MTPPGPGGLESNWIERLKRLAEERPIVILHFRDDEWDRIRQSRRGGSEFTVALSHDAVSRVRPGEHGQGNRGLAVRI